MKQYDTVVFDLDGTLLNTLEDLKDSVNFALSRYGFPSRTVDEVRGFLGNGIKKLMEEATPDGKQNPQFENCFADFKEHYSKNMENKTAPYEGILALLDQLKQRGYRLAIVSNKFDTAVKKLDEHYFKDYISIAIGESASIAKKPAPDTVFQALKELHAKPETAVYVGDSEVDVQTAHNSALPCIGVSWGFRGRKVLKEKGADFIIDTPSELLTLLD